MRLRLAARQRAAGGLWTKGPMFANATGAADSWRVSCELSCW